MGIGALKRAVFLDRDGVLNKTIQRHGRPHPPAKLRELEIFPEAKRLLGALKRAGFVLIVVTNQPDVARGTQSRAVVDQMHQALRSALPVDDIRVCFHDDSDQCGCRKPLPGLLVESAQAHGIDLARSFLIGDRWRDIEAGAAAGCRTVWIDYQYQERGPSIPPAARVASLAAAVEWILAAC